MNQRLKTFLIVSLTLNVLLAGMILGEASHLFSHYFTSHDIKPASTCCDYTQESQLPEDKRKLFDEIMRPALDKMQAMHNQIDMEKKKALSLLQAEPFNEKLYRNQIRHISDMHAKMKQDMAETVIKLAQQLTPQERAILADIISSHPPTSSAHAQ